MLAIIDGRFQTQILIFITDIAVMSSRFIRSIASHYSNSEPQTGLKGRTLPAVPVLQQKKDVIQRVGESEERTDPQSVAASVQGTGNELPHYDRVQASFGQHDISHVQAYTSQTAAAASAAIGAQAYTSGAGININGTGILTRDEIPS